MGYVLKTKYTDLIIEMDADLSQDPSELSQKISLFSQNKFDLLI